jgi:hypothetical protein
LKAHRLFSPAGEHSRPETGDYFLQHFSLHLQQEQHPVPHSLQTHLESLQEIVIALVGASLFMHPTGKTIMIANAIDDSMIMSLFIT